MSKFSNAARKVSAVLTRVEDILGIVMCVSV